MKKITPVLLAGGTGTRLWPVSRKTYPKQFSPIMDDESLFQAAVRRLAGPDYAPPLVMTNADFRFIVAGQLEQTGVSGATVVIEPAGRNTAPAILAAAQMVASGNPLGLVLVAPSDHMISDSAAFSAAVVKAAEIAETGRIVVFGVRPDRPASAYGYLELAGQEGDFRTVRRFIEKPATEQAAELLADGDCLWNAGIFLFQAQTMIDEFRNHAPEFLSPVQASLDLARHKTGFLWLGDEPWRELPDRSVDYAIMEKSGNIAVCPLSCAWADLGGWDAVWHEAVAACPDGNAVVADEGSTAIDCQNVLLRSGGDDLQVVGIGLRDTIVVATSDAVLVADLRRAQDVRLAVDALVAKRRKQAVAFPRDHRPWGWYETLVRVDRFQVKRIMVEPGASLSLQKHMHRSEHWVVVSGTALVVIDDNQQLVTENESVYVPLGAVHRLTNPGKVPVILIEVQTGVYLEEDDIIRYHDQYARPVHPQMSVNGDRAETLPVAAQADVNGGVCHVSQSVNVVS